MKMRTISVPEYYGQVIDSLVAAGRVITFETSEDFDAWMDEMWEQHQVKHGRSPQRLDEEL